MVACHRRHHLKPNVEVVVNDEACTPELSVKTIEKVKPTRILWGDASPFFSAPHETGSYGILGLRRARRSVFILGIIVFNECENKLYIFGPTEERIRFQLAARSDTSDFSLHALLPRPDGNRFVEWAEAAWGTQSDAYECDLAWSGKGHVYC